ncbi:hypothetical protein AX15_002189 [Amanita polypyramis BW_CC]|nr:hypothetical protein AX15_002189 [Amanita polypyramis BW_CC]
MGTLQHEVETHRNVANELRTVKEQLAEKDFALTRSAADLRDLQGRFDAQTRDQRINSETLTRDQVLLSTERAKCESLTKDFAKLKCYVAEKEQLLTDAENRASVFQERLDAQKMALQMTKEQLEVLQV